MRSRRLILTLAGMAVALCASTGRAVTDEQVRQAIRKGVQFLYSQQHAWGHWDEKESGGEGHGGKQYAGWTSIVCYALLSAGEEWQQEQKLRQAMQWLSEVETKGTYAVGLRAHVWPKLPDNFLPMVVRDAGLLKTGLNAKGGYRYELGDGAIDNSCTQYGVLGAWECAKRAPGSIPNGYWQQVEGWVAASQTADGGWGYTPGRDANMNMTSAGLAMAFITRDFLHSSSFQRPGVADAHPSQQRINRGLEWFDQKFNPSTKDGYGIVGVERVGLASGYKYFGGRDWYQTIADKLVQDQGGDGSFSGKRDKVVETSFALIFLSRGRVPVSFNKLKIPDYSWHNRPRDMAMLNAWLSDEFEQAMNWQVVGIDRPAHEWLDAPVLYLASHKPLALDDSQAAKLKRYIDLGGILVTHADGSNDGFTESVQQLAARLFPPYEMKALAEDDYLYNINYPVRRGPRMLSVHNGVRHLWIHFPRDIAEAFQIGSERLIDHWYTMGNVFLYATEVGEHRPRLAQHFIEQQQSPSRSITVARPKHQANWNPEPGAWTVQGHYMTNEKAVSISIETPELAELGTSGASLAHITGTEEIPFTNAQADAIRQFVEGGGTVLFESPGGTPQTLAFLDSVKKMLGEAFAGKPIQPIPHAAAVVHGRDIGGFDCTRVDFRDFYKKRAGPARQVLLMGIMIDGQPRVLLSHEDMTEAMVAQPVWGVFGYDTPSAQKLMTNIVLWADKFRQGG